MKSLKIAIILCLSMAISLPALAVEQERPVFVPRERAPLSMSESGAQVSFAGEDEEKGLFELFVKKQDSLSFNQDPLADQLNAIEPAAGIQFRLEF
jgi:hypothetical protein